MLPLSLKHKSQRIINQTYQQSLVQSCVAQLAHEKPLELDQYADPVRNFFPFGSLC